MLAIFKEIFRNISWLISLSNHDFVEMKIIYRRNLIAYSKRNIQYFAIWFRKMLPQRTFHTSLLPIYLLIIVILFLYFFLSSTNDFVQSKKMSKYRAKVEDFRHYECKDIRRIGGIPDHVRASPEPLGRIDGAWFVCFDKIAKPTAKKCNVLSFGINIDDYFDHEMANKYGCEVHSFDPFIESSRIQSIRDEHNITGEKVKISRHWTFYKIGISSHSVHSNTSHLMSFDDILILTKTKNKIIDVFKIDIEGEEKKVFETWDIEYVCRYVKQFVIETHPDLYPDSVNLVRKLNACFVLFRRDTRFFKDPTIGPSGYYTEFTNPNGYLLQLKDFKDEIDLANFMFTMGELYFINVNFIK